MLTIREAKALALPTVCSIGLMMYTGLPLPYLVAGLLPGGALCGVLSFETTRMRFYDFFTPFRPYNIESRHLRFINENYENSDLKTACLAVLEHGITTATFRLANFQYQGRYSPIINKGWLTDPVQSIVDLISDPNSRLTKLNLVCDCLTRDEVERIYNSIPPYSSLEEVCISYYMKYTGAEYELDDLDLPLADRGMIIFHNDAYQATYGTSYH